MRDAEHLNKGNVLGIVTLTDIDPMTRIALLKNELRGKKMIELLGAVGSIVLVDLVLSGDNALVIGAAAARLPRRQRWYAILLGGGAAIILRVAFAVIATFLLRLPLLQAIGGLLLLIIALDLAEEWRRIGADFLQSFTQRHQQPDRRFRRG